ALHHDAAARCEVLRGEMLARRDEVGETVHLLLALAVFVPAIALVLAAAHMGDGVDEAAIDEAERGGREAGGDGHAVRAVAVEERGRGAVEWRVLAIEQRHWDGLAVFCRRHNAAGDIERGVVAARDLLRLAKR